MGSGAEKVEHAHLSMWHKENARTREARNSRAHARNATPIPQAHFETRIRTILKYTRLREARQLSWLVRARMQEEAMIACTLH